MNAELNWAPINSLSRYFGTSRLVTVSVITVVFVLFVVFGLGKAVFSHFVGAFYPTIASFRAVEDKDIKAASLWLTYWVAFVAFATVELIPG